METISIVVPVYRAEQYLARCIDSVIGQTYENFELILVDDGSPDKSGEICDNYAQKDPRIKVIHKKNEGVSLARNTGIKEATGKYLMFIDSDDYIQETMLEEMAPYMEQGYDLVFSATEMYTKDGVVTYEISEKDYSPKELVEEYCSLKIKTINFSVPWNKLFRRDIIEKNNLVFNQELNICEDTLFNFIYLTYCNKVKALPKAYYKYMRDNEESLATKYREYMFRNRSYVYRYILEIAEKLGCSEDAKLCHRKEMVWEYLQLIYMSLQLKSKEKTIQLLKEMSKDDGFLENIQHIKETKLSYLSANLIKHKAYQVVYYLYLFKAKFMGR